MQDFFQAPYEEIFDAYVLWPFDKSCVFILETRVDTLDFTVSILHTRII